MIKNIYFRGEIDFCNYSCSYCPFAKKSQSKEKLSIEKENLEQLYNLAKTMNSKLNIMITPYGEALVHPMYQELISRLCILENVEKIGIQTNLSLDVDKFLEILGKNRADFSKIMIWATFHEEYTNIAEFSSKANKIAQFMAISCGIVANTKNYKTIQNLRENLSHDIYLWINAMDRIKNRFTNEDITELSSIDPLFAYEFYKSRVGFGCIRGDNFTCCQSYNKIYIDGQNRSSSCFFKKKRAISKICDDHKVCDCYLGYSNFEDNFLHRFFGDNAMFRIPQKENFDAIFVDVDGVLTTKDGRLKENLNNILSHLAKKTTLYLATARSLLSTRRLLGKNFDYFSGGVFSDGAYIADFGKNFEKYHILNDEEVAKIKNMAEKFVKDDMQKVNLTLKCDDETTSKYKLDKDSIKKENARFEKHFANSSKIHMKKDELNEKILRLSLPSKIAEKVDIFTLKKRVYNNITFFQNIESSKLYGIRQITKINAFDDEKILIISDNIQDDELFENISQTVTPLYQEKLHKKSRYILDFEHLPFIVR